jgi:hypothetical protein
LVADDLRRTANAQRLALPWHEEDHAHVRIVQQVRQRVEAAVAQPIRHRKRLLIDDPDERPGGIALW